MSMFSAFLGGAAQGAQKVYNDYLDEEAKMRLEDARIAAQEQLAIRTDERNWKNEKARAPEKTAMAVANTKAVNVGNVESLEELAPRTTAVDVAKARALSDGALATEVAQQPTKLGLINVASEDALARRERDAPRTNKLDRQSAQAKHIVDPSYTMVPNADGTVLMFNSRNPGAGAITLKDDKGEPIVRKDPEELRAATALINAAGQELKIAEAAYKADPTSPTSVQEWKNAQDRYDQKVTPAMSILTSKANGGKPAPGAKVDSLFPVKPVSRQQLIDQIPR